MTTATHPLAPAAPIAHPSVRLRALGVAGMLGAPMLLLHGLLFPEPDAMRRHGTLIGVMGLVYLVGWACSLFAVGRLGVLGRGRTPRVVLGVQWLLLGVALVVSVQETVYGGPEHLPLPMLDIAWPLGHTFMLVTGTVAARARTWGGWRRWAVLAPGFKIPLLVALVAAGLPAPVTVGGRGLAGYLQVAYGAAAFLALGWAVWTAPAATRAARGPR